MDGRLLSLTDSDPFDEEIHEKIVQWEIKGEKEMGVEIGCSDGPIDCKDSHSRQGLTNGGVFFTDALRAFHKTDVAMFNGGSIRGNREFPKGKMTKKTVTEMHPFGNSIAKIYVTGGELRKYIDVNLNCWEDTCGNFVQVSGLNYTFNPKLAKGKRLIDLKYTNGTDVQDSDVMTTCITDYMLAGSALQHNKLFGMTTLNDAVPVVTALFDYIKHAQADGGKCIAPKKDGRIKLVE